MCVATGIWFITYNKYMVKCVNLTAVRSAHVCLLEWLSVVCVDTLFCPDDSSKLLDVTKKKKIVFSS